MTARRRPRRRARPTGRSRTSAGERAPSRCGFGLGSLMSGGQGHRLRDLFDPLAAILELIEVGCKGALRCASSSFTGLEGFRANGMGQLNRWGRNSRVLRMTCPGVVAVLLISHRLASNLRQRASRHVWMPPLFSSGTAWARASLWNSHTGLLTRWRGRFWWMAATAAPIIAQRSPHEPDGRQPCFTAIRSPAPPLAGALQDALDRYGIDLMSAMSAVTSAVHSDADVEDTLKALDKSFDELKSVLAQKE